MNVERFIQKIDHILNNSQKEQINKKELLKLLKESRDLCSYLYEQATIDFLTKLYNRRYFDEQLELAVERSQRYKIPFSLILLDIDHFKRVNDLFGHIVGDKILQELAKLIKKNVRKIDIPARYGGEEFAIIIPGVGLEGGLSAAKRLKKSIETHLFPVNNRNIPITVSMGIGTYKPYSQMNAQQFLKYVDKLLYMAKEKGRNRVIHEITPWSSIPEGLSSEEKKLLLKGVIEDDD